MPKNAPFVVLPIELAQGIDGLLCRWIHHPNNVNHQLAAGLQAHMRAAIAGSASTSEEALAGACLSTLDELVRRGHTNDRGDFVVPVNDAERDAAKQSVQVIGEIQSLRHYLRALVEQDEPSPVCDLARQYIAMKDTLASLHASMQNLGFYDDPDDDTQVDGDYAVDLLSKLASRVRAHLDAAPQMRGLDSPSAIEALAGLVDQIRGLGIPDWNGAEGLSLARAIGVLESSGYTVSETAVELRQPSDESLEVETCLVLSTDHLPEDIFQALREAAHDGPGPYDAVLPIEASRYSVRVQIQVDNTAFALAPTEDAEIESDDPSRACPPELQTVVDFARSKGFRYIRFDVDTPALKALPYRGHGLPHAPSKAASSAPGA